MKEKEELMPKNWKKEDGKKMKKLVEDKKKTRKLNLGKDCSESETSA
jgi:hypothetical protein